MADNYKVLGQSKPVATTLTDIYTVGAAKQVTVSTINVCNLTSVATTYRISVAVVGAVDSQVQYLFFDDIIDVNETKNITAGYTLGAGDVIRCYSASGNISFNIFGVEIT